MLIKYEIGGRVRSRLKHFLQSIIVEQRMQGAKTNREVIVELEVNKGVRGKFGTIPPRNRE